MSEELIQKKYTKNGDEFGDFEFYNLGNTNIDTLKSYKIVPNRNYGEYSLQKPDGLICDRRNKKNIEIIAVIEHKIPAKLNTKQKKIDALKQCNDYCHILSGRIGIVTDGDVYIWINPMHQYKTSDFKYKCKKSQEKRSFSYIVSDSGAPIKDNFDTNSTISLELIHSILHTVSAITSKMIKPNTVSPAQLAKQVWQAIWLATGDNPKQCLMTFTELFIFKFLSDLNVLSQNESGVKVSFDAVYDCGKTHCLKYYLTNVRPFIRSLFPPSSHDETTIINGLSLKNKQNQDRLFYDILQSFRNFGKLSNIDPEFKSRLFEDFLKGTTGKKQLAQFFTPRNVIKAIVEMAKVKELSEDAKILDPACGVGGFIIESILNRKENGKDDFYFKGDELVSKIGYTGFDYDDITIILAKANELICLTEVLEANRTLTTHISALLSNTFMLTNNSIVGSLEIPEKMEYDLIMSNPPYVSKGLALYRKYIEDNKTLKSFYNIGSVGKEGLFVQRMVKALKKNGYAFIILPDGFFYRPADNNLKTFILDKCTVECIVSLPEKTFYSTTKKTYILGIRRKENISEEQKHPVLCGIIQSIGESLDINRISIHNNDLATFSIQYKFFNADKANYKSSQRWIKTILIENFSKNLDWLIEQYWTQEEKTSLGLVKPERDISVEDIYDNIDFFRIELSSIKRELQQRFSAESFAEIKYFDTNLFDTNLFLIHTANLGFTKKQYARLDTKDKKDIPIFTATLNPVAHIKPRERRQPFQASDHMPHISFASDGDGTAGTNIVVHTTPYYLNTSRIAFSIKNSAILPKYIYYYILDMKKKYTFNYKYKANLNNIQKIQIKIPLDSSGENFSTKHQKAFVKDYKKMLELKKETINKFFNKMLSFKDDIDIQLSKKVKESFLID